MKSKTMRVSIRAFTFALFGLFLFVGIWACKKDATLSSDLANSSNLATPQKTLSLKVKNTKSWFEDRQKKSLLANTTHLKKMQPLWDKAISYRNIVEVPFQIDGKFRIPTMAKGTQTQLGRQRLIIYHNSKGVNYTVIASYMPSLNFTGKIKDINSANLKHLKFDGIVRLYNAKKEYLRTLHYEKGVLLTRNLDKDVNILSARSGDCYEPGEEPETEWACWQEAGETICRESVVIKPPCEDDDDGDGDPCDSPFPPPHCDSDPCNSPFPPLYCNNDPCSGPNPPAYCGGNGDFCAMYPELCDPCLLFPTLCGGGDNGGGDNNDEKCKCKNYSAVANNIASVDCNVAFFITVASMSFDLVFSDVQCHVPSYSLAIRGDINTLFPITASRSNEGHARFIAIPITSNDLQCGHTVSEEAWGQVDFNGSMLGADGSLGSIHITKTWLGYASQIFLE
jgi:hypothetical protein